MRMGVGDWSRGAVCERAAHARVATLQSCRKEMCKGSRREAPTWYRVPDNAQDCLADPLSLAPGSVSWRHSAASLPLPDASNRLYRAAVASQCWSAQVRALVVSCVGFRSTVLDQSLVGLPSTISFRFGLT